MSQAMTLANGWVAVHDENGLHGNVTLRQTQENPGGPVGVYKEVAVPAAVLLSYAAAVVRNHKKAQLDDASSKEILGLR